MRHPEWRGAHTLITSDFNQKDKGFASDLTVRTKHAEILSWLIYELRDAFTTFLDGQNKYGFYEELAQAALNHLASHQPEADDHRPLLRAVLSTGFYYLEVVRKHHDIPPTPPISSLRMDEEGRQIREYPQPGDEDDEDDSEPGGKS